MRRVVPWAVLALCALGAAPPESSQPTPADLVLRNGFNDHRILYLNEPIGHQVVEQWHQALHLFDCVDKLNPDRQVFHRGLHVRRMPLVVRTEAGMGPRERCA